MELRSHRQGCTASDPADTVAWQLTWPQSNQDSVGLDEEAAVRSQLHQHGPVEGGHPPGLAQRRAETNFLHNLVELMPARIQDVIDRDGGMTK
jgi:hypothetical protein